MSASKWQVFFNISQILECLALHFIKQVAESQPDKSLAKNASNVSTGVYLRNSPVKVKDTHLMNNNQPMAEILCVDCQEVNLKRMGKVIIGETMQNNKSRKAPTMCTFYRWGIYNSTLAFNTLWPRQNGHHFPDDNFKHIFLWVKFSYGSYGSN